MHLIVKLHLEHIGIYAYEYIFLRNFLFSWPYICIYIYFIIKIKYCSIQFFVSRYSMSRVEFSLRQYLCGIETVTRIHANQKVCRYRHYVERNRWLFQPPRFRALDLTAGRSTGWIGRRTRLWRLLVRPRVARDPLFRVSLSLSDERGNFLRLRVDLSGAVV